VSTYHSPSAEAEKAARYLLGSGFLLFLAAFAWAAFAIIFSSEMSAPADPAPMLGLALACAVTLTVFSAALGVMSVVQTLHNEQMRVLRSHPADAG
jgi:hypothetical protein